MNDALLESMGESFYAGCIGVAVSCLVGVVICSCVLKKCC